MGDLDKSPLFDSRHLHAIRLILDGGHQPSFVTSDEKFFFDNRQNLCEINDMLEGNLVNLLGVCRYHFAVPDTATYLIKAHEMNKSRMAIGVLNKAVESDLGGTVDDLMETLSEKYDDIPGAWSALLELKMETRSRLEPPITLESGLNLDAMRKFS